MSNNPLIQLEIILAQFGIEAKDAIIIPIKQGLINATWKIETAGDAYILQKVNHCVFKNPEDITHNIAVIDTYLDKHYPDYVFTGLIKTINNEMGCSIAGNYYRMFPFINGSHSKTAIDSADQAREAAKQFGQFTALLKNFDAGMLKISIPDFHNISLRYAQFLHALKNGNEERISASAQLIDQLIKQSYIVEHFEKIKRNPCFKLRVTHHDTKISNVLFDNNDKAICIIDLDTLMPGYFISDVGDMIRTYLSPVTEEEQDLTKIKVRQEVYDAIVQGYLHAMESELSEIEKEHFFYAGCFMIYMQALRFITDHIQNDVYYGAAYPNQNFYRAANQATLLGEFMQLKNVVENKIGFL